MLLQLAPFSQQKVLLQLPLVSVKNGAAVAPSLIVQAELGLDVGDPVGEEDGCGVIGDRVISSGSVGGIEG